MQVRAIVLDDIDTVAIRDVPVPRAGPNEVLVRVQAGSVNGFDLAVAAGRLKDMVDYVFPVTLGKDFAGVVVAVGEEVAEFGPGEEVFGFVPGMALGGAFAEFAIVPADVALAPSPAGLDVASAGGVGSYVVQIAAAAGAYVIATARTSEDCAYLRDLGAADIVSPGDPYPVDVEGLVDLIHHADGAEALYARVASGGRVASATYTADVEALAGKGITGTNIMSPGDRALVGRLCGLVEKGKLRVPLSAQFTLDEGPAALAAHAGHKTGKIGLSIGS
jgi:NADPH:quinone reductase-like Zn-dependent oxidoreductase